MKNQHAFPHVAENWSDIKNYGMTLRDYFAAKAMQAYITANYNRIIFEEGKYDEPTHHWTDEELSKQAYETANAMMKARDE